MKNKVPLLRLTFYMHIVLIFCCIKSEFMNVLKYNSCI